MASFRAPFALIYCALALTVIEYFGIPPRAVHVLKTAGGGSGTPSFLAAGIFWSIACVAGYALLPTLIHRFTFAGSWAEIGCSVKDFRRHLPAYLGLFLMMAPLIYLASTRESFALAYPFVPEARESWRTFLIWEGFYVAQFFALESFFRGYLLFTLEAAAGRAIAICAMAVPYTMIHFHKPFPEAMGALIAGLVLGWLALRNRSWLGGAVLHSLVGVSMDALAAHAAGLF